MHHVGLKASLKLYLSNLCYFHSTVLPHPPKSLTSSSIQSMSVTISWSPGFDGYSSTLRYILEISRKVPVSWTPYANNIDASRSTYTVYGLEPFSSYMFRMRAVTNVGQSAYSAVLEVKTLESGQYC